MKLDYWIFLLETAFSSLRTNKLRTLLTALGIIFGVAAVVTMMAIGEGAQKEILQQMKSVGINNIIIKPQDATIDDGAQTASELKKFSPGLTLEDAKSIQDVIPQVHKLSVEVIKDVKVARNANALETKVLGIGLDFFAIRQLKLLQGQLFNKPDSNLDAVCVIGSTIKNKLFNQQDPIGNKIKCGHQWLTVVGVVHQPVIEEKTRLAFGVYDYNQFVFMPIASMLIRLHNKTFVEPPAQEENQTSLEDQANSHHLLDRMIVQVAKTEQLTATSDVLIRLLQRRHNNLVDFEVHIPSQLLQQKQRTRRIFNGVLGAIAGISLLVGGIGIMNIMLANVLERIREIGLRRAVGARKNDVVYQFLMEASLISLFGGIVGAILGVTLAFFINQLFEIPITISAWGIGIAFTVSLLVGVIFGFKPAQFAANQSPTDAIRHE